MLRLSQTARSKTAAVVGANEKQATTSLEVNPDVTLLQNMLDIREVREGEISMERSL